MARLTSPTSTKGGNMTKRIICFIIAFAMCLGIVPINSVNAEEEEKKLNVIPLDDGSYMIELPNSSSETQLITKRALEPMGAPTEPNTITPETDPDKFEEQWVKTDVADLLVETLGITEVTLIAYSKPLNYSGEYTVKLNGDTSKGEYKIGEDFKALVPKSEYRPAILVRFPDGRDSRRIVEAKSKPTGFTVNIGFLGHTGVQTKWFGNSQAPSVKAKYTGTSNRFVEFDLPTVNQNSILRIGDRWLWKDHENVVYLQKVSDVIIKLSTKAVALDLKTTIDDKKEGQLGTSNYIFKVTGDALYGFTVTSREKVSVDFDAGKGSWKAPATKPETQYTGHSLTVNDAFTTDPKLGPITVPNTATDLTPPAEAGKPENKFKGWSVTGENGPTVDIDSYQIKGNTTFTAIYEPVAQGKVAIQYVDKDTTRAIDDKYKLDNVDYPKNVEGNVGEAVEISKIPEPKFIGYKRTADPIDVSGKTYKEDRIETVEVNYEKIDDIVQKEAGKDTPDGYVDITFTNAKDDDKTVSKFDSQTAAADIVYSINPKAGVKIVKDGTSNKYQLVGTDSKKQPLKKDVPVVKADEGYKVVDHQVSGAATGWNYDNYDLVNQALTEAKTFTAKVEQKDNGTAKLAYVDENNTALDPLNTEKLQINGQTYNPSLSGKEGTALPSYTAQNAPKLLGYVFVVEVSKKANNADVTEYKEGQEAVITLKYKKLSDAYKGKKEGNDDTPDVPGNDPNKDDVINTVKDTYVKVKFLADETTRTSDADADKDKNTYRRGKLDTDKNEVFYYINPKAQNTLGAFIADTETDGKIVVPTINPKDGYKKASPEWNPDLTTKKAEAVDANNKELKFTAQYKALTIAEIITKANLAPVTLKVWVGDTIPWKDGVKVADTVTDETLKTTIEGYLKDKKTSYKDNTTPERTSKEEAVNEPRTGTIRVTFSDKSYIDVEKQDLYVIPHVTAATNDKAPKDAIEVTFMLGEGVKAGTKTGAETAVEYAKYKVKPSTNLDTYKLGTGKTIFENINAEVTDATKYTGVVWEGQTAKKPEDHVVTNSNKVFTAKAAKIFKVKHVFKGIDADKDDTPEIAANELPEELKAGANSLIPADKTLEEKKSYTPSNIDTKVTQTIKNAQDEVTMVYEWTFKEWKPNKIENISETETVTGIWERRQATSDKPTVDQPKAEDTVIKGKGKKGSTIVVTTPDGKTHKTTVGDNGDWSVTVPPVKENDKIKVTQEEKGKKPSDPVDVTVERKIKYFGHFYEPSPDYLNKNVPAKKEEKAQEKYLEAYRWYVKGNDMGMFMPKKGITRAEVAQMFARALEYDKAMVNVNITPYTDVDANAWYYEAVQKTSAAGIFKGSDKGTFMPTREITKAELIATIARFQHLSTKAGNTMNLQMNHWATAEVEAAYQEGWLDIYTNGTAQFAADEVISREEVVTILNRAFGRIADTKYIDDNAHTMTNFPDATKDMWSYYEIMTAANTYLVDKMWVNHATKDNGPETLKEMIEWVRPLIDNKDVREVVEQVRFQR